MARGADIGAERGAGGERGDESTSDAPPGYELHEPNGWAKTVAGFDQVRSPDGASVTLSGDCPRCGHEMSVELAIEERTGKRVNSSLNGQELHKHRFIKVAFCNCTSEHEGRAVDRSGCGAYGGIWVG